MEIYRARRKALLDMIGDEGIIFIPSEKRKTRTNDIQYPFRQNSNFFYLTGYCGPSSLLIMHKINGMSECILFMHRKNSLEKKISGCDKSRKDIRLGFNIDKVNWMDEVDEILPELLKSHNTVYIDLFQNDEITNLVRGHCLKLKHSRKKFKHSYPKTFIDFSEEVSELRAIKDASEIQSIINAIDLTKKGITVAMAYSKTASTEHEVSAMIDFLFKENGGTGPSFESTVASGQNATTLHYSDNSSPLKDGDLILIDAGAEFEHYASDITRTFPRNGKFTKDQSDIYSIVLSTLKECEAVIKPEISFSDIYKVAKTNIIKGLIELGVLKCTLEEGMENKEYLKYFPHSIGHWLGLDVHDVNPYIDKDGDRVKLKDGMVMTIEPGIYFEADDLSVPEKYRGIGIRIEDNILVTHDGHINLSSHIPREINDIEAICAKDFKTLMFTKCNKL